MNKITVINFCAQSCSVAPKVIYFKVNYSCVFYVYNKFIRKQLTHPCFYNINPYRMYGCILFMAYFISDVCFS